MPHTHKVSLLDRDHSLHKFSLHPADSQWPANSAGPSPVVLECRLQARHGVDTAIEFVENVKPMCKGEGGYAEDNEFFGSMANI